MREEYERRCRQFRENRVTNWHEHIGVGEVCYEDCRRYAEKLTRAMRLCGMDRTVVTSCITGGAHAAMETIARGNDAVGRCCLENPGVLYPLAYVDPVHGEAALREIERCRREYGILGIKLYNQYTIDNDIQDPLLDYCADEGLVVLMHAGRPTDPGFQPYITDSTHMARAAKKHPETRMIMAHIAGGGDWNFQLRGLEDAPNVYVDISGSVLDAGTVEGLVRRIGASRVLFGTDGSFSASIGRLLAADLTDDERLTIMDNPVLWSYVKGGARV